MPLPPLPVSRSGRRLDLGAAILVIGGGALYAFAYIELERLRTTPLIAFTRGMAINQLAAFHRLESLSRWALGAIVLGVALAIFAWRMETRTFRQTALDADKR